MAATTVKSQFCDTTTAASKSRPRRMPAGPTLELLPEFTFPTTSLDDVGDRYQLLLVPHGAYLQFLYWENVDMETGGPTLDLDIVIDEDGTETAIWDDSAGGNLFRAANTGKWAWINRKVNAPVAGYGIVLTKVIAAATTPGAGTFRIGSLCDL